MIIERISANKTVKPCNPKKQGNVKVTLCKSDNDCFTSANKKMSFKGVVGGGFGLGLGGLAGLLAASATGVGIPAVIAMMLAGEVGGAVAGHKIGEAIGDDDDDY